LVQNIWPSNIRELENVIHHSLLICKNNIVRSENLQLLSIQLHRQKEDGLKGQGSETNSLNDALHQLFESGPDNLYVHFKDTMVKAAYSCCHNNQVQTAKLLGISRNVIRAKLIKMGAINALR